MKNKNLDSLQNQNLIKNDFLNNKRKLQKTKYNKNYQNNISKKDFINSIELISAENKKFNINKKAAKRSGLLKNCIEDDENFKKLSPIEIDNKILKLIIEYLKHYKNSEPRLPQKPLKDSNVMKCNI